MTTQRLRSCATCERYTLQDLEPTATGGEWHCTECNTPAGGVSPQEMEAWIAHVARHFGFESEAGPVEPFDETVTSVLVARRDGRWVFDANHVRTHYLATGKMPTIGATFVTTIRGIPASVLTIPLGLICEVRREPPDSEGTVS